MSLDPFVGKVIDNRYEIQARVGEGGMGVVYKARQLSIDRVIALKMLNPEVAADPTWVQRFYNEAKACSRLQHPNTIRMFDFGQTSDGRLFMTMEFLDGMSLRQALQAGPLAGQRVAKILIQCCASLAEAHSIGIIHRDIKPDNVFLMNMAGSPDFVKLLDFSVAKLLEARLRTQAGIVFGTPQYMSPEQGRGMVLDARSDLYALGVLAFEMVTGRVPFYDDNPMQLIQLHLHAAVPRIPDTVAASLQAVVLRALEKDPARRYQSAGEMMQHCQQVFADLAASGYSIGAAGMPRTLLAPSPAGAQVGPPGAPIQARGPATPPHGSPQPRPSYTAASPHQKTLLAAPTPIPTAAPVSPSAPNVGSAPVASPNQKTFIAGMTPPNLAPDQLPNPGIVPPGQPVVAHGAPYPMQHQAMPYGVPSQPASPQMQPPQMPSPQMQPPQMQPPQMQPPQGIYPQGVYPQGVYPQGAYPQGMPLQGGYPQVQAPMQPQGVYPQMPQPHVPSGPNKTIQIQPTDGVVSLAGGGHPLQPVGPGMIHQAATTLFWIVSLTIGASVGAFAYLLVRLA